MDVEGVEDNAGGRNLSYLLQTQKTTVQRVRRKNRFKNTTETGIEVNLTEAEESQQHPLPTTANQRATLPPEEEDLTVESTGDALDAANSKKALESSFEEHHNENFSKYPINYEPSPRSRILSSPARLEPIVLGKDDIRELLEFAREKGRNSAPKWQREGITAINQFLIHLEPFSDRLSRMQTLLRSKVINSHGPHELLLFFLFWYSGLTIETLLPSTLDEIGYFIYQIRTPIRRIHKINSEITTSVERAMKKFGKRLTSLTHELDKAVYHDLLRLTPSLSSVAASAANQESEDHQEDYDPVLQNPNLIITSISTYLLLSWDGQASIGSKRMSELSDKGKTYLVQSLLSSIQELLTKVQTEAQAMDNLLKNSPGADLKRSIRELVKELKKMRKENGLKHINASRNFSNSVKVLESEILRTGKLFRDIYVATRFIEDAVEACLEQGKIWVPETYHQELTAMEPKTRNGVVMNFKECLGLSRGQEKKKGPIRSFHEFFASEELLDVSASYQVRIPMRRKRMEFLFPPCLPQDEIGSEDSDDGENNRENQPPVPIFPLGFPPSFSIDQI